MHAFIIVDSSGQIVRAGSVLIESDVARQAVNDGEAVIPNVTGRPGFDRWNGESVEAIPVAPPTLDERKAALIARLAERRWEIESGGFKFRGKTVKSDADSQAKINALMTGIALLGSSFSTSWKCIDGWLKLDSAGATDLVETGLTHVSSCFA